MYLLDTNVISELRKAGDGRANQGLVDWFSTRDAVDCFISSITLMELEIGVLRIERKDSVQGALLRDWLENRVLSEFETRTLVIDARIARRCANLHVPDPKSERDALIAATAIVHGMTLVTRNVGDFESTGVTIENPWV